MPDRTMLQPVPLPLPAMTVVIETARLRLRHLHAGRDAAAMLALLNDPGFLRGIGDRGVRTRAQATAFMRHWRGMRYALCGFGHYAIEERQGTFLGTAGLIRREDLPAPDIGYALLSAHHGHGYAEEAARGVMAYAREVLELPRLLGIASPDNARSIRLLEKLGLRYSGEYVMPDGKRDALYAIEFGQARADAARHGG